MYAGYASSHPDWACGICLQFFILGIYLAAAMLSRDRLSDLGVLATLTGCKIFQVALGLVDEVLTGRCV